MNKFTATLLAITIVPTACGDDAGDSAGAASSPASDERGGTVTVGETTWTFVPSMQCGVYPNGQVNISGHAAEDQSLGNYDRLLSRR